MARAKEVPSKPRVEVRRGKRAMAGDEGRWEFERNIGTGGFGLVKLFTNQVTRDGGAAPVVISAISAVHGGVACAAS